MKFKRRHWTVALLAAASLQLALSAALYHPQPYQTSNQQSGVEIAIGTALASIAGTEGQQTTPGTETANSSNPVQQVKTKPSAATNSELAETDAFPDKEAVAAARAPAAAHIPAVISSSSPTARPKPSVKARAIPLAENKPTQTEVQKPVPQISGVAKPKTAAGAHSDQAGSSGTATSAAANTERSGVTTGVSPEYYRRLAAWLEKHKRYPRRAVQRRQQGVVKVSFKIDRQGNLLSREIIRSSGYRLLDEAADSLLQRASPMPGIPHQSAAQVLEVIVPIMFALR